MSFLIQNGTLILPHGPVRADLRTDGEKIVAIGPNLPPGDSRRLDATGLLVFPGFIDTHTHLEMNRGLPNQTADDWFSGTRAALAGGTTTVLDFAEPAGRADTLSSALDEWHRRAQGQACCHYGFHMTVKRWDESMAAQMGDMVRAGVSSFKVYMAYDNLRISDADAFHVIEAAAQAGGIAACHCENGDLVALGIAAQKAAGTLSPQGHPRSRPPVAEAEAVARWLALAEQAGAPVNIVHLSSLRGLEAVRAARSRGQAFYVETCPQYLLLDDAHYAAPGFEGAKYVLSPPLRAAENLAALWQATAGGEIDTIGTDHCSFHYQTTKQLGRDDFSAIPNGIPGVEHRPALLYTHGVAAGRITAAQMARLLAEQPAKLFGLWPRKGQLAVGSDADIVLFDPGVKEVISAKTQQQNVDYTPYEGVAICGRADTVLLSGALAVQGGQVRLTRQGQFLHRGPAQLWR